MSSPPIFSNYITCPVCGKDSVDGDRHRLYYPGGRRAPAGGRAVHEYDLLCCTRGCPGRVRMMSPGPDLFARAKWVRSPRPGPRTRDARTAGANKKEEAVPQ